MEWQGGGQSGTEGGEGAGLEPGAGPSRYGRGPAPDAESSDSPRAARTRSLLPPRAELRGRPGRGGPREPGHGRPGPRAGGSAGRLAVGAATMEFRQEEFRKLAGRALGRLHR